MADSADTNLIHRQGSSCFFVSRCYLSRMKRRERGERERREKHVNNIQYSRVYWTSGSFAMRNRRGDEDEENMAKRASLFVLFSASGDGE